MATDDFFRARLDAMIDLKHPLAVLATRLPWAAIEVAVAPKLARQVLPAKRLSGKDLLGAYDAEFGGGVSPAGRPRLPIGLMASLLYLKNSCNLSDEELVERWAENVVWQFFSGMDYYEPRLPCDPTQIGRFRRLLGEDGIEQLFKATIECAVQIKAVLPADLERGNRRLDRAVQGDCPPGTRPSDMPSTPTATSPRSLTDSTVALTWPTWSCVWW